MSIARLWSVIDIHHQSSPIIYGGLMGDPLKNMKVNWDDDIPKIWKNKKCSKPPTSLALQLHQALFQQAFPKAIAAQGWVQAPAHHATIAELGGLQGTSITR